MTLLANIAQDRAKFTGPLLVAILRPGIPEGMADDESAGYPRKRARTRAQIRRAGIAVLADRGPHGATVGEVARSAGVAQGTFYNHFQSLDDLVDEIAEQLGSGVEIARDALDAIERDPAIRVAIGVVQLLEMADRDAMAGAAFVSLVAAKPDFRARVRAIIGRTIADGVADGRFDVEAGPAAINAVLGACLQSMRSLSLGEADAGIAPSVGRLVLRALGVEDGEATRIMARALDVMAMTPSAARNN